jgi:hypothetical protein
VRLYVPALRGFRSILTILTIIAALLALAHSVGLAAASPLSRHFAEALVASSQTSHTKARLVAKMPGDAKAMARAVLARDRTHRSLAQRGTTGSIPLGNIPTEPAAPGAKPPSAASASLTARAPSLKANFDGTSDKDDAAVNGSLVPEAADPAICAGQGLVAELTSAMATFYTPSGSLYAGPLSLNTLFMEPSTRHLDAPRCVFDASTSAFFFSVGVIQPSASGSRIDLLVSTPAAFDEFVVDASDAALSGCPCTADDPSDGYDPFNLYVSTNQYSVAGGAFEGADIYALDKIAIIGGLAPNVVEYPLVTANGIRVDSLRPAVEVTPDQTEYFLNAFRRNPENRIEVWALTSPYLVSLGGTPPLSGVTTVTESYAPPPPTVPSAGGMALNAGDARLGQVELLDGVLWTSLETRIVVPGDLMPRTGAAWFELQPRLNALGTAIERAHVLAQSYLAFAGMYLLYPALMVSPGGTAAMTFSLSDATADPGAGYAAASTLYGPPKLQTIFSVTRAQLDADLTCGSSAACPWGRYASAGLDPANQGVWLVTAYMLPGFSPLNANWGTRIVEVRGS